MTGRIRTTRQARLARAEVQKWLDADFAACFLGVKECDRCAHNRAKAWLDKQAESKGEQQ